RRRRADHLRRRLPDHAGVPHRRRRLRADDPADAGAGAAPRDAAPGAPDGGPARAARPARLRRRGKDDGRRGHGDRVPVAASPARAVTPPALSLAFFDPDRRLHGTARTGATVLFEGTTPSVVEAGP